MNDQRSRALRVSCWHAAGAVCGNAVGPLQGAARRSYAAHRIPCTGAALLLCCCAFICVRQIDGENAFVLCAGKEHVEETSLVLPADPRVDPSELERAAQLLAGASRPLMVVGEVRPHPWHQLSGSFQKLLVHRLTPI